MPILNTWSIVTLLDSDCESRKTVVINKEFEPRGTSTIKIVVKHNW